MHARPVLTSPDAWAQAGHRPTRSNGPGGAVQRWHSRPAPAGRSWPACAAAPVHMMATPTMPVVRLTAASTVASVSAGGTPAATHCCTTAEAMADRKMRPTSCTWPAPKGQPQAAPPEASQQRQACMHAGLAWRDWAPCARVGERGWRQCALPCQCQESGRLKGLSGSPTTKRMRLHAVTVSWCRAEERTTSLTREPRWAWNQGSCFAAWAWAAAHGGGGPPRWERRTLARAASAPTPCQANALSTPCAQHGSLAHPEDDGCKRQLQRQRDGRVDDPSNHRSAVPCPGPLPRQCCRRRRP